MGASKLSYAIDTFFLTDVTHHMICIVTLVMF